ncbi:MAG TPA: NAD-dependent epimerase/dehydratase family protein [Candidatus Binatia bacterium]|nr:NAD-dependent epimerase/dehydratase family protein [Candidatus Binatia bacterium]
MLAGQLDPGTTLVFAAALTPDRGQTLDTYTANVAMAATVARALERQPAPCVYISSDAVYGFDVNPVTEETAVAPGGYYALAKYTGEKLLEYAAGAKGFPLLSLRVAAAFGPGDPHGSYGPNGFARSLARDRSIRIFGQGEEERDHVHVDDVARLAVALMRAGASGVFNIATGRSRSFAQVIEAIRKLVPYEVAVTNAPRKSPITHRSYDITRLDQAVPGFPFTPLEDGLRATLAAFGAL